MSVDKLVDSTQLDADLTSVANAIRTKGGTSAQLAFPADFVSAIGAIPSGDTILYNRYGTAYAKKMTIPVENSNAFPNYNYCDQMEEVEVHKSSAPIYDDTNQYQSRFDRCTGLKKANIKLFRKYGHFFFRECTALEEVSLGQIGVGVTTMTSLVFDGCTQSGLTITIYVDDETSIPFANSPFGATNATIVYRSSTTGEARTV